MALSFSHCLTLISIKPKTMSISKKYSIPTPTVSKLYGLRTVTVNKDYRSFASYAHKNKEFESIQSVHIAENRQRDSSLAGLKFVDSVLRLGIEYNFQENIEAILRREYKIFHDHTNIVDQDLYEVSLRFRLLRQGLYRVSSDVFNKFKDINGKFNQALVEDKEGLMQLYEASQLSLKDEHILEEAEVFSRNHLEKWLKCLNEDQTRTNIIKTLEQPYHNGVARFTASSFLATSEISDDEIWPTVLHEMARKEFKIVQSIHQNEISAILKWWKELGLTKELKFARDQPLKWYMWTLVTLTDPRLSDQSIELTKPISLIYIVDDIFDLCETLDELTLFTQVVDKWEIKAAEQLPSYLKICFKALDDITNDISHKVYRNYGWNPTASLRKVWAKLCNAFLVETRWFRSRNLPDEEEYLTNAIVTSGVPVIFVHAFYLLGQGITEEAVSLLDQNPSLVYSTSTILRLWDDLGSSKDENQNGHDGSYVECYMKQHEGCEIEEVREKVMKMIRNEWKKLNGECLESNQFSVSLKKACLDAARMVPIMYDYSGEHRVPPLEEYMKSLLSEQKLCV